MPQSNLVFLEEHQLAFRSIFGDICHGKCLIESNVSEPPNLKIFWGRIPPDKLPVFGTLDKAPPPPPPPTPPHHMAPPFTPPPPPVRKILCYGPVQPFTLTIIPFLLHMLGHIACWPLYRPRRIFHLDPKGLWVLLSLLRHYKWCSLDLDIVFCKCSLQSLL